MENKPTTVDVEKIMSEIREEEKIVAVDIERIVREIRAEIAAEGHGDTLPEFSETGGTECEKEDEDEDDGGNYLSELEMLNTSWNVQVYRSIKSHRPIIGRVIVFFKKVVRKLIKFYIEPIVNDQTEFNVHVVRVFNGMDAYIKQDRYSDIDNRLSEVEFAYNKEVKKLLCGNDRRNGELANKYVNLLDEVTGMKSKIHCDEQKINLMENEISILKLKLEIVECKCENNY